MSILNNITSNFVQTISSESTKIISESLQKYAKITFIALTVIGAAVAAYLLYKSYVDRKVKPVINASQTNNIPSTQVPKPPAQTPPKTTPQPVAPTIPQAPPMPSETNRPQYRKPVSNSEQVPAQSRNPQESIQQSSTPSSTENLADTTHDTTTSQKKDEDQQPESSITLSNGTTLTRQELFLQAINLDPTHHMLPQSPAAVAPTTPPQQMKTKVPKAPFSDQVDAILDQVSSNVFTNRQFSTVRAFSPISKQTTSQILSLLDEVIAEYETRFPPNTHYYQRISFGQQVPAYFAQVKDQSDVSRKYLSLVGIRNLLHAGPSIIDDFAQQKFLGGAQHYSFNTGLNAFKYSTGTVVDLDTRLKKSIQDPEAAKDEAKKMIIAFGKKCGIQAPFGRELTAEEVARQLPNRKLHLPGPHQPIHQSHDNNDRSNHGLWMRQNPQTYVMEYFVNVPDCDVVLGATLRLPYVIAELIWRAKESNGGNLPQAFLDDFFKRGVSDMCFNDKFGTFMDFYIEWMAKFDGAETPEETVTNKIISGAFGDALKAKGAAEAIKQAFTRATLINFIDQLNLEVNGRDIDQWMQEETDKIIAHLEQAGHWEKSLYHTDGINEKDTVGSEYFLLDRKALQGFLKHYYSGYLIYL